MSFASCPTSSGVEGSLGRGQWTLSLLSRAGHTVYMIPTWYGIIVRYELWTQPAQWYNTRLYRIFTPKAAIKYLDLACSALLCLSQLSEPLNTHIHTHMGGYIYIYIHIYTCKCTLYMHFPSMSISTHFTIHIVMPTWKLNAWLSMGLLSHWTIGWEQGLLHSRVHYIALWKVWISAC